MILTNIVSVLGLLASAFFAYGRVYMGLAGPAYYPFAVSMYLLGTFVLSYLFSLFGLKMTFARATILVVVFAGVVITSLFSILVAMGKTSYPMIAGVSGAYIELVLLLVLIYLWTRQR